MYKVAFRSDVNQSGMQSLSCNADVVEHIVIHLVALRSPNPLLALHRTCRQLRDAVNVAKPHCYARCRTDNLHRPPFATLVWLLSPRITSWQATMLMFEFSASVFAGHVRTYDPRGLEIVLRKASLPRWETIAIALIDQRCPLLLEVLCAHMGRDEAIGPLVQRCMYPKMLPECVKVLADACFGCVLRRQRTKGRKEPDMLQLQGVMQLVTMQSPKGRLAQAISFVFLHVLDDGMRGVPGHYRRAIRLMRPHLDCYRPSVLVTETLRLLRSVAPACES